MKVQEQRFTSLDLNPEDFKQLGYKVIDMIADYYASINNLPVFPGSTSTEVEKVFEEPLPERAQHPDHILNTDVEGFYGLKALDVAKTLWN